MRELPVTLALSLLVHTAGLAWFVVREEPEAMPRVARTTPRVEILAPVEPPAVEVALLDDHTLARFRDDPPEPAIRRPAFPVSPPHTERVPQRESAIAATATTATTTELPPREPPTTTPHKPSLLTMRRGPDPGATIHRPGSDGISDEELEQMTRGGVPVKIANLPGAQADADLARAQARLHDPKFVSSATPDELTAARFDRYQARQDQQAVELVAQKDGTYTSKKTTFTATVKQDGTVDIKDGKNWKWETPLSARFDVTDAFMRSHGQDPYAAEKLRYLDRTRDQRVEIGKRYRTAQLAQSARLMAANLQRLWAATKDPVERKAMLLQLWDECAETGDAELVAGGAEARRLLLNFVQTKRIEFTPAELAAFNARKHSQATFP